MEVARDSAGCLCLSMEIGKGGQRMQITGSRGLPEPGGSRGSTDRKAVYKVVFLSLRLTSSPSVLSLSLSSPLGLARCLSLRPCTRLSHQRPLRHHIFLEAAVAAAPESRLQI